MNWLAHILEYLPAIERALAGIYLTALGNRCWGGGYWKHGHVIGVVIIAVGLWIMHPAASWSFPKLLIAAYVFRVWHDSGWLDRIDGNGTWAEAILRSLPILAVTAVRQHYYPSDVSLLLGLASAAGIAATYSWVRKQSVVTPDVVSLAEPVSGAFVGIAGVV